MLDTLIKKNPTLSLYTVHSPEFARYGAVHTDYDVTSLIKAAKKLPMPESGSYYCASVKELEADGAFTAFTERFGGTLPIQLGICNGRNDTLAALEYHCCNEINVAATAFVLLLAKLADIKDGVLDSKDVKAFYVEEGECVEMYADTLHYCPCEVSGDGFVSVVVLLKGTNLPLEKASSDKLLFARNKWLFAHEDNRELLDKGVVSGIKGENYTVKY